MNYKPKDLVDCLERYGQVMYAPDKKLFWPAASKWVKPYFLPKQISDVLINSANAKPVERIFCNTDIHEPLDLVFDSLLTAGCFHELKTFDGCYNVRYIRGSQTVLSLHSFAIALDLNARSNPMGGRSSWSDRFIRCWLDVGWVWGGEFQGRKDPMHFQWCGESAHPKRLVA